MTLQEYLNNNLTKKVCISANQGSGWFFFGTGEEALNEVDKLVKNEVTKLRKRNIAKKDRIIELSKDIPDKDTAISYADKIGKLASSYLKVDKYLECEYEPVLERTVIDTYARETDEYFAVVVKGLEKGNYWDFSKWKKDH